MSISFNIFDIFFAKLEALSLVHQAGFDAVDASKKAGLWNFMNDVDNFVIPKDLKIMFENFEFSHDNFEAFSPSNKRFILRYIKLAKTQSTRQKKILQLATLAAENNKVPGL